MFLHNLFLIISYSRIQFSYLCTRQKDCLQSNVNFSDKVYLINYHHRPPFEKEIFSKALYITTSKTKALKENILAHPIYLFPIGVTLLSIYIYNNNNIIKCIF